MKTCARCHQPCQQIKARGLCGGCYKTARNDGSIDQYNTKRTPNTPPGMCPCGRRLYRQPQKDAGLCSICAGTEHARAMKAEDLIEDAEFLASTGETMENAARRLGMNRNTFERALHRYGRHDIYRRLLRNGALV